MLAELPINTSQQGVDAVRRLRGQPDARPRTGLLNARMLFRMPVNLVVNLDPRDFSRPDPLDHLIDRGNPLRALALIHIDHMQQQVGFPRLFQGRLKGCHQIMGQIPDKPHRIGQQHGATPRRSQAPQGGIQRGE